MSNADIPIGYKQTEVGVIPVDWEVKKLNQCLKRNPTYGINAPSIPFDSRFPTYIRITDISEEGRFIEASKASVNHPAAESYLLEEGDIVFARTGASVGKSYLYKSKDGYLVFAGFLIRITPNKNLLEPAYLWFFAQSSLFWLWIKVNSMRSGQPGINGHEYGSLVLPIPTKSEQSSIETVLTDTDSYIEKLEHLIEKKKQIKQGAMQELLTVDYEGNATHNPKRRLPGFSLEWEEKQLLEIANFYDNLRIPVTESIREDGTTPYYGANGIQGYIKGHTHDGEFVLIAEDGANDLNNYPVSYVNGKIWVNNHAHVIQGINNKTKTKYLSYALKAINFVQVLVGGTRAKLNGSVAKAIRIKIPVEIAEQTAIAAVLSDMDTEIEKLETQLLKYKEIKQGMMQQLLTGKIRLILNRN